MVTSTHSAEGHGTTHGTPSFVLSGIPDGPGVALALGADTDIATATAAVNEVCSQVEDHRQTDVVVIRVGPGDPDVAWPGPVPIQVVNRWERAVRRLERIGATTLLVARGRCAGPALDLLLVSDYRIMADGTEVVLPTTDELAWPGMSLYRLSQQLGVARARQILLWRPTIPATLAFELGLVDEIHDGDAAAGDDVARRILAMRRPGAELAIRRRLMLEATSTPYEEALGTQLAACDRELRRARAQTP